MIRDKYSATWVSYSSITDYLKCPRSYFLKNIYKDPQNRRKMQIVKPALILGQVVHEVIEQLSILPSQERFKESLIDRFNNEFAKFTGKRGGFSSEKEEKKYLDRGFTMMKRLNKNPGPIAKKIIKIRQELPNIWLDENENIILCGKIDWLEYFPESDSVGILDFKTGKSDEDPESLQLRIYHLLAKNIQKRNVTQASYWYLDRDDEPMKVKLPELVEAKHDILEIAKKIELARKLEHFICKKKDGCFACLPYEDILLGKGEHVGTNEFGQDIYVI
ncbi:MAG: hypothetical protein UR52_C0001G0108 [Candidatus Gottesmanbacteria bacterium GW2011_GWA1_34_13]|uniref:PD-(D/E)XK endonuclease-like domain-containing protein n=1 Tax=Candidatus Gottesmanbacteria bacterium GW2011_GWA1_34_13 TaxID=1618434 RepID=A0A0G0ASF8_9BACT|nr:MAG: hypothetical protein UR52_C0001G0108 [Candidatus Gottesmanbacteria bacterium GW2011_GWA1_34_13]